MKNKLMVSVLTMMLPILSFAATVANPSATHSKSAKSRSQKVTSDVIIGSLKLGGDIDCPVVIQENSIESCAKFGFVDPSLQISILNSINQMSNVVKVSGKWSTRETSEGRKASLFVIEYIATE